MLRRLLVVLLFFPFIVFAEDFVAGKDYLLINTEVKPTSKLKITEYFSYGCPWCYRIEPKLNEWLKQQGPGITFSRVPVIFNKDWEFYAKAYYTAQQLGLEAKLNPNLFKTIQEKKHALTSNEALINFFVSEGVDPAVAKSAFEHSTTIDLYLAQSIAAMSRYQIKAVPAVIINNQYKTDLQMAKSPERFFKILDFLVARARKNA